MSNRLSIRVSQALRRQLDSVIRQSGKTESEVAREALEAYCQQQLGEKSAYDLFKEAGLIGDAKGLPSDLSTNPKYMEGFGRD